MRIDSKEQRKLNKKFSKETYRKRRESEKFYNNYVKKQQDIIEAMDKVNSIDLISAITKMSKL